MHHPLYGAHSNKTTLKLTFPYLITLRWASYSYMDHATVYISVCCWVIYTDPLPLTTTTISCRTPLFTDSLFADLVYQWVIKCNLFRHSLFKKFFKNNYLFIYLFYTSGLVSYVHLGNCKSANITALHKKGTKWIPLTTA